MPATVRIQVKTHRIPQGIVHQHQVAVTERLLTFKIAQHLIADAGPAAVLFPYLYLKYKPGLYRCGFLCCFTAGHSKYGKNK